MHFLRAVYLRSRALMLLPEGNAAWRMKWVRAGVRAMGGGLGVEGFCRSLDPGCPH